jgi:hypothetical protein
MMLTDFPVMQTDAVVKRTLASCAMAGLIAIAAAVVLGYPLAGLGVFVGLIAAIANLRVFQASTVRYINQEGKLQRKPYVGTVAARLGLITIVALALLYLVRPVGFGMLGGLVLFQATLMMNAMGALWRYHKVQLGGTGPIPAGPSIETGPDPTDE